jgi:hypothetical protein
MKTALATGLILIVFSGFPSGAAPKQRTQIIPKSTTSNPVRAKYPLPGYIHPKGILSIKEEVGDSKTAYLWRGIYKADPNYPPVKSEIARFGRSNYGVGDAAVSVYCELVKSKGIKTHNPGGMCGYNFKDRQGKTWRAIVRGDYHSQESGEFSVFIGIPGG